MGVRRRRYLPGICVSTYLLSTQTSVTSCRLRLLLATRSAESFFLRISPLPNHQQKTTFTTTKSGNDRWKVGDRQRSAGSRWDQQHYYTDVVNKDESLEEEEEEEEDKNAHDM